MKIKSLILVCIVVAVTLTLPIPITANLAASNSGFMPQGNKSGVRAAFLNSRKDLGEKQNPDRPLTIGCTLIVDARNGAFVKRPFRVDESWDEFNERSAVNLVVETNQDGYVSIFKVRDKLNKIESVILNGLGRPLQSTPMEFAHTPYKYPLPAPYAETKQLLLVFTKEPLIENDGLFRYFVPKLSIHELWSEQASPNTNHLLDQLLHAAGGAIVDRNQSLVGQELTGAERNRLITRLGVDLPIGGNLLSGNLDGAVTPVQKTISLANRISNPEPTVIYMNREAEPFLVAAINFKKSTLSSVATLDEPDINEEIYRSTAGRLILENRLDDATEAIEKLKKEEYRRFTRIEDKSGEKNKTTPPNRKPLTEEETKWAIRNAELDTFLEELSKKQRGLLTKSSRTPPEEQQLQNLNREIAASVIQYDNFLNQMWKAARDANNVSLAAKLHGLEETQVLRSGLRELGEGAVALYTLVEKEKYSIVLIAPDTQLAKIVPIKEDELIRHIQAFRQALQEKQNPLPTAQQLYRILIAPIAPELKRLQAKTLMWSLDGVLRYVPMAALHDGQKYLVEDYNQIVFTPASLFNLKDVPDTQKKALGLGITKPFASASFQAPALPAVKDELQAIIRTADAPPQRGILPGAIKLDEAFTREALFKSSDERFRVLHIASHFQFNPGSDKDSFLLLGDGNPLSLYELRLHETVFKGVDLLALSACDTATGSMSGRGKEVEGFAVLAQRQGAKAIIASLWPIADRSTALLMQGFYRNWATLPNKTKAEALRQAQLELLRGTWSGQSTQSPSQDRKLVQPNPKAAPKAPAPDLKTRYAHPYYWAPFILVGNWK